MSERFAKDLALFLIVVGVLWLAAIVVGRLAHG